MLINARAFIRIMTFLWEGDGRLTEAISEMAYNIQKIQFMVNIA